MGRGKSTPQDEAMKSIVSSNIKKYLKLQNKKAIDLQKGTGISQSSISEYINGKSLPNPGNLQKISNFFGVLRENIDPRHSENWEKNKETSSTLSEINQISSKLEEPRQQVVLETAKEQYKEQESEKKKVIPLESNDNILTEEELQEAVDQAVAFDGKPFDDREKEIVKQLLRQAWEDKHGRG